MKNNLKKSQALIEMAIFGTIILAMLGSLLSYVQKMNEQEYVTQEAFRRSLAKAYEVQSSVSYTVFANKRNVSVSTPLLGDRTSYSGSGSVLWGIVEEGEDDPGGSFYKINDDEVRLDFSDGDDETEDPSIEDIDTSVNTTSLVHNKKVTHNPHQVTSYHKVNLNETITYTFKDESGNILYSTTQAIGSDGTYSATNAEGEYTQEREWVSQYE